MVVALSDFRAAFSQAIVELGHANPDVVVLCNDSKSSSSLAEFEKAFPNRFFNIGIAEQNMMGIASGLASCGKIPFVCGAACFVMTRACEQVKVDVAYANVNVKIIGSSAGLSYGPLGPTHHALEDIAIARVFPNMRVLAPADGFETRELLTAMIEYPGPAYMRLGRHPVRPVHSNTYKCDVDRVEILREGSDVSLIACGTMVANALEAASLLDEAGVSAQVVNVHTLKPIDSEGIVRVAETTKRIVTVEEHSVIGGLGSIVAEVLSAVSPVRMLSLGVPGVFSIPGPYEYLLDRYGLSPQKIAASVLDFLGIGGSRVEKVCGGS